MNPQLIRDNHGDVEVRKLRAVGQIPERDDRTPVRWIREAIHHCLCGAGFCGGWRMPDYWRFRVPGGTYFFTVALLERKRDLLVAVIGLMRESVRRVKRLYSFEIVAWVVLPDHLHCI